MIARFPPQLLQPNSSRAVECAGDSSGGRGDFGQAAENSQIPQQLHEAVGLRVYGARRDLQLGLQISASFMAVIPWLRGCHIPWQHKTM